MQKFVFQFSCQITKNQFYDLRQQGGLMSINMTNALSLKDVYQKISSMAEGYSKGDILEQIEAREFFPVIVRAFLNIKQSEQTHITDTKLGSRRCTLTENEKNLVRQVIDKLITLDNAKRPLLGKIVRNFEEMDQILSVIDFLIENECYNEVENILIRGDEYAVGNSLSAFRKNELDKRIDKLPEAYQTAIRNAYYLEYGSDEANLYQHYIIGEKFQAS